MKNKTKLHLAQQEVYYGQLMDPKSSLYNIGGYIIFKGKFNAHKFREIVKSCSEVFDIHKIEFDFTEDEPSYYLKDTPNPVCLDDLDFSLNNNPQKEASNWMQDQFNKVFNLLDKNLYQLTLIKISEEEYFLFGRFHHIIVDGYGFAIYLNHLIAEYNKWLENKEDIQIEAYPPYNESIGKSVAYLESKHYDNDAIYWKEKYDVVPEFVLSTNAQNKKGVGLISIPISESDKALLNRLSEQTKANVSQLTIAALLLYYGKTVDQNIFSFGLSIHNRRGRKERKTFGMFASVLPYKGQFKADQLLTDTIAEIRQTQRDDFRHGSYPISHLNRSLNLLSENRVKVFDILVNNERLPFVDSVNSDLSIQVKEIKSTESIKDALSIRWFDYGQDTPLELHIDYEQEYFNELEIKTLIERLLFILRQFETGLNKPIKDISILPKEEENQLLTLFNDTGISDKSEVKETVVDLFEKQVKKTPKATAIRVEESELNYQELDEQSTQLARHLIKKGVKPDTLVGLCVNRSLNMMVGLLGILKSGSAYVPIDPSYPESRVDYMLKDSGVPVLVSDKENASRFSTKEKLEVVILESDNTALLEESTESIQRIATPANLAYVIYTSGSTGNPKGVLIAHKSLIDYNQGITSKTNILDCTSFGITSSIATDLGNTVIYTSLLQGGSLYIFSEDELTNSEKLSGMSIDCLKMVPSHWKTLQQEGKSFLPKKCLLLGGEQFTHDVIDLLVSQKATCDVYNHYGPTETTIGKLVKKVSLKEKKGHSVPLGIPFGNTEILVLDTDNNLCPIGVTGELSIGGSGLAVGYLNRADLTKEKFVENPFKEGEKIYKTGDLARWLSTGEIEFIGRKDDQIKIRGYRVELGEIDNALTSLSAVTQGCVLAREDENGDKRLIGYVVQKGELNKEELQESLQVSLPEYMVPQLWIRLEELPLTSNGKIDKKALPDPDNSELSTKAYVAPRTEVEEQLATIWQDLLKVEKVGVYDNFFELGGQSLMAIRLISRIKKLGYAINIRDFYSDPTIGSLSTKLASEKTSYQVPANGIVKGSEYITPSMVSLVALNQEELDSIMDQVPGGGSNIQDIYPLSPLQEGIYFHHLMSNETKGDPYVISNLLSFPSDSKRSDFINGLEFVINRHDVFRTCVLNNELPEALQIVLRKVELNIEELPIDKNQEVLPQVQKEIEPGNLYVDLSKAPMLNVKVADDIANESYYLIFNHHHLIIDHIGMAKVREEIMLYLAGKSGMLPEPSLYREYIGATLDKDKLKESENYFTSLLKEIEEPTYPFNLSDTLGNGATAIKYSKSMLSINLRDAIRKASTDLKISPATLFHSAFGLVIGRCSGKEYVLFGSLFLGRLQGVKGSESSLGLFMNTLPMLLDLKGDVTTYIKHVDDRLKEFLNHEQTPLSNIHKWSGISNDVSMFSALLNYRHSEPDSLDKASDLGAELLSGEQRTNYPFSLEVDDYGNDFELRAKLSNSNIDTSNIIGYMEEALTALLEGLNEKSTSKQLTDLSIIPKEESHQLLETYNDTSANFPTDKTLVDLFNDQVKENPEGTAIIFEGETVTYKELEERSNQLAHYLVDKGISVEDFVGVCLDRSTDMIVSILGILKSGGVYVPIDPTYPEDRKRYIIENASINRVLSHSTLSDRISGLGVNEVTLLDESITSIQEKTKTPLSVNLSAENLAYIIYTSGSTGKPKGVMIEHGGICNTIQGQISLFSLSTKDNCLQYASPSFDASMWEILLSLSSGATLCIIDELQKYEIDYFVEFVKEQEISFATLPPAFFKLLDVSQIPSIKTLVTAGEAAPFKNAQLFSRIGNYFNAYGPTETSICATIFNGDIDTTVPIGTPVANTTVYLLNDSLALVPIGAIGELCIGGSGVARGYLNREDLTAEKFIFNPFKKGERLYKTGDLARRLPDGNIEFIGRKDNQVKIRGYRIELGEIENTLSLLPGIKQNCVLAQKDSSGTNRLVAYVVTEREFNKESLQKELLQSLPEYMVPQLWISLDEMPLTFNGKIDKKALPSIDNTDLSSKEYIAPRTEIEKQLAHIWKGLLGVEQVGVYDNFFELGGHSLLATRLVSMIRKELDVEINIRDIFTHTTIDSLHTHISTQEQGISLPQIVSVKPRPNKVPLSFSQERLWFLDQLQGSAEYHIPFALRLSGDLNKEALAKSLHQIVKRQEILRTVIYSEEGVGYQGILSADAWELFHKELSKDSALLKDDIKKFVSVPFNMSSDYMFRSCLYDLGENEYVLAGVFHHISSDGWSQGILVEEFTKLYSVYTLGNEINLPLLPLQYADYSLWQREHLEGTVIDTQLQYWETKLKGVEALQLPIDYARPSVQSVAGASLSFSLSKTLSTDIKTLSNNEGVTVFMTLLTAFKLLLSRYSGQQDICVGTPIANRTQKELEDMIGFFVNTLALRTQVTENVSFQTLLERVKQTTLEAYDHQQAPFEKIVDRVVETRNMNVSPLFQVMFILQNTPDSGVIELDGLTLSNYEDQEEENSKFDLTMTLNETDSEFSVNINYCTDLFKEETIQRMFIHYQELLQGIVKSPSVTLNELSIISEEEKHQLLNVFNDTATSYPKDKTVIDLIEEQVAKTPEDIAVVSEGKTLTYKELDERSNQLARYLINQGVNTNDLVGICIDRSEEMIVSILGILKSGGAYVPIDPEYPQSRIDYIQQDANVKIVLSDRAISFSTKEKLNVILLDEQWNEKQSKLSEQKLERVSSPGNLAYVIYTSGSTGKPKGVMNTHKGIINRLLWTQETYGLTTEDVVLQKTTFSFDVSVWELLWPLISGAKLVFARPGGQGDVTYLKSIIEAEQVTTIHFVPSMLSVFLAGTSQGDCSTLRRVLCSGEALSLEHVRMFRKVFPKLRLDNLYGPTEAAIDVSSWSVPEEINSLTKVPIGKPVANTSLYVVDVNERIVPIGVVGELCIGGDQVSKGYLNREDLTSKQFISNPFKVNDRIYKTGDLAKWLSDGTIEYIGRKDSQVKVRGYRIELGEIENALSLLPGVIQSCVLAKKDVVGSNMLVGYVVLKDDLDKEILKSQLAKSLPEYMVPQFWVVLDKMPLTASGKLDRKSLPSIDSAELSTKEYVAPRTETEEQLALIWQDLLGVEKVGVYDNFFELGGHSLLAVRLVSMIVKELKVEVMIKDIFNFVNIEELSAYLDYKKIKAKESSDIVYKKTIKI